MNEAGNGYENGKHSILTDEQRALMENNRGQVFRIANKMNANLPKHITLDDLVSLGNQGLLTAAQKYNREFRTKFETFAFNKIRGAILDGLRKMDYMDRDKRRELKRHERIKDRLRLQLGREPTSEEMAQALGMELGEYQQYISKLSMGENSSIPFDDLLSRRIFLKGNEESRVTEKRNIIRLAMEKLDFQEMTIIEKYYFEGFNDREISVMMDLSESFVSGIRRKALTKLFKILKNPNL